MVGNEIDTDDISDVKRVDPEGLEPSTFRM